MDRIVRARMDMVGRVRTFSRAHPSDEATYQPLVDRFEERWARAEALATQQRAGGIDARAGAARARDARRRLQRDHLPLLVRLGEQVAKAAPDLLGKFQMIRANLSRQAFATAARAMVAEARAHQDAFVALGMTPTFLDELDTLLDQFDAGVEQSRDGRHQHVGARADLVTVTEELTELVRLLDGVNRYRFQADPELLAAWNSARNIIGPRRARSITPPPGEEDVAA